MGATPAGAGGGVGGRGGYAAMWERFYGSTRNDYNRRQMQAARRRASLGRSARR